MSNVKRKDRSPHRFTTLDAVLDVYDHTIKLLANPNKFNRQYMVIIDNIANEARMIYHLCRVANEDLDNRKKEEAEERLRLQKEALSYCLYLKTDIRIAKKVFHLRASSVIHWTKLVNIAMESIKLWHRSEQKFYKEHFGM